ncbi:UPF0676 protein C1494.01 isoform X1 [Lingula anatina]|uniref:UPF0676 protein C1494.01 isoform X1 n=1 Tax=Lingula anatina TaxID=7574 RepID=A0A1S3JPS3_LINAN|nr:UPF0676 protein C1494.01 isoform X1 [Lingula anatina]|eukprot:XP_013412357.1 UPF0676 protein C1494.01 isoform X1 [Lingula anatina]
MATDHDRGDCSWIPIVDIKAFDITKEENEVDRKDLEKLANDVFKAFSTIGFVYVKNHGIPQDQIDNIFRLSDEFFAQPQETKDKFVRPMSDPAAIGYIPIGREYFDANKPADLKESFDAVPGSEYSQYWPNIPNFEEDVVKFHRTCAKLGLRLLKLIGMGLGLEDSEFFVKAHEKISSRASNNTAILRLLHYPPVKDGEGTGNYGKTNEYDFLPEQTRCGEHTDYGSMTLLFQDDTGGLEVQTVNGEFKPATPIPGTVVVNIADMMQRWTADGLKSTPHRVVPSNKRKARRSVIYFIDPDRSTIVRPLDGSNKYPPISYVNYLSQRFADTGMLEGNEVINTAA